MSSSPDDDSADSKSALGVLEAATESAEALGAGVIAPTDERRHILLIAEAVDRSLRRCLRDTASAAMALRLKALASDELSQTSVINVLLGSGRLSDETGRLVRDLADCGRRLADGEYAVTGDAEGALQTVVSLRNELLKHDPAATAAGHVELKEDEAVTQPAVLPPVDSLAEPPQSDLVRDPHRPSPSAARTRRRLRRGPRLWPAVVAVLLIAVAAVAFNATRGGDGGELFEQGLALFQDGEYAEAANHFWRYAEANPRDATPHLYLARIHRRMGRPALAEAAILEAERLAPEDPAVDRESGFLLLDAGRPEEAVQRFRASMQRDAASPEAWIGLVRGLREAGQPLEADAALADAPADVQSLLRSAGS